MIDSKTNAADGSVTFDAIKYTQDDIYEVDSETGVYSGADTKTLTYTISEVIPEGAKDNGDGTFLYNGYTYDGTVYTVELKPEPKAERQKAEKRLQQPIMYSPMHMTLPAH